MEGSGGFNLKSVKLSIASSVAVEPGNGPVIPPPTLFSFILVGMNHGQEKPIITVALAIASQLHRTIQSLGRLVPVFETKVRHTQGVPVHPLIAYKVNGLGRTSKGLLGFSELNILTCHKHPGKVVKRMSE